MKPTFLELRHLRTLLALKETGSVSMAAKRVYLTQSALSHQIKLMEEQFGLPLFERKSNPLRFTAAGDRLIRLANEILPKVVDAERELCSRKTRVMQGQFTNCSRVSYLLRLVNASDG